MTLIPSKPRKTVKSGGLEFTVLSSRERCCTLGGRYFFCIGRNISGWTLFEHDQDITMHGQCRSIGRKFERLLDTKALVAEIQRLVETGDKLPTDCRPPWEIDEARHYASQSALEAQRPDDKRQRVHDCGARY